MSGGKMRLAALVGVAALADIVGTPFHGRYRKARISRFKAKMRKKSKTARQCTKATRAAQLRRGNYRAQV